MMSEQDLHNSSAVRSVHVLGAESLPPIVRAVVPSCLYTRSFSIQTVNTMKFFVCFFFVFRGNRYVFAKMEFIQSFFFNF